MLTLLAGSTRGAEVRKGDHVGLPLRVDPDELRTVTLELHQLAAEAAELNADLAHEAERRGEENPWFRACRSVR
jgi:hypothetical protein